MSRLVRKRTFCICENKDADQLRGYREADQRLSFRYTDSTIPLLPKSKNSSLWQSPVAVQPGLCQTLSESTLLVFPRCGSYVLNSPDVTSAVYLKPKAINQTNKSNMQTCLCNMQRFWKVVGLIILRWKKMIFFLFLLEPHRLWVHVWTFILTVLTAHWGGSNGVEAVLTGTHDLWFRAKNTRRLWRVFVSMIETLKTDFVAPPLI